MASRWSAGDRVVLREVWRGRVWSGRPVTVVRDQPDLVGLYIPAGATWMRPVTPDEGTMRLPKSDWKLVETRQPIDALRLATPGADHSVLLLWPEGHGDLTCWYVNLEEPLRRTPNGFDYMDQTLDVVISPDFSEWHWKDEDELAEAVRLGLISEPRAKELRAEGERVVASMEARQPPFDADWPSWRPDPCWPTPELPEGWDDLP